jgi:UDP:flavonoid glycosyltransferase YjiC (YdhE family)
VPQVVVPHLLDQHFWGARVVDLGLGPPPLLRRRLDAAALAGALVALQDNDVVAVRASELGERLRARLRARDVAGLLLAS